MRASAATWSELQFDALRELGNVGTGRAAGALSKLLAGLRVVSELPRSAAMQPGTLASLLDAGAEPSWVARFELGGSVTGELLVVVPTVALGDLLADLVSGSRSLESATALSALAEAANIMGSAYLDGAASLTGLSILPSPPVVERQTPQQLDDAWWQRPEAERGAVAIATSFSGRRLRGTLVLVPSLAATSALLAAMRLSA